MREKKGIKKQTQSETVKWNESWNEVREENEKYEQEK